MERERKKVIRVVYRRVKEVKRKKELEVIGLYKYDDLWVGECFEEKENFFLKNWQRDKLKKQMIMMMLIMIYIFVERG